MVISLVVTAITFGCATWLAVELVNWLFLQVGRQPKIAPETSLPFRAILPLVTGVVGAMLASYNADWKTVLVIAIVCTALAMATWGEVVFGVVPDVVLLVPLAILVIDAFARREWGQIAATVMLALPFVVLMFVSKGKGVARSDIELAALGGAILGFKFGIIAFVVALIAAFAVNYQRRGQGQVVELTPYMSSTIVAAILVRLVLPADISG